MEITSKTSLCSTCNQTTCSLPEGLVEEERNLPLGYTYLIYKDQQFRIKEVADEPSAIKWIQKFRSQSNVIWKIKRTYPNRGRYNVYKSAWRCHRRIQKHNSGQSKKRIRYSKDTDCPAKLVVTVKKLNRRVRSTNIETQMNPYWPCIVRLESSHNHHLETIARNTDNNNAAASDNIDWPTSEDEQSSDGDLDTDEGEESTDEDEDNLVHDGESLEGFLSKLPESHFTFNEQSLTPTTSVDATTDVPPNATGDAPVEVLPGSLDLCFKFEEIFDSIRDGITEKPDLFLPAIRKMVVNFRQNVGSESDLIQALNHFGKIPSADIQTDRVEGIVPMRMVTKSLQTLKNDRAQPLKLMKKSFPMLKKGTAKLSKVIKKSEPLLKKFSNKRIVSERMSVSKPVKVVESKTTERFKEGETSMITESSNVLYETPKNNEVSESEVVTSLERYIVLVRPANSTNIQLESKT